MMNEDNSLKELSNDELANINGGAAEWVIIGVVIGAILAWKKFKNRG